MVESSSTSSSPAPSVRSWRTAFLTLRDETLTPPPPATVIHLLNRLVFSHSDALITVAPDLPPHEVTSDVMYLMELTSRAAGTAGDDDFTHTFTQLSQLVHDLSYCVSLDINQSDWALVLNSYGRIVKVIVGRPGSKKSSLGNASVKAVKQCLETVRHLISGHQKKCSLPENTELLNFLLGVVECFHTDLFPLSSSCNPRRFNEEFGRTAPGCSSLLEVQTTAFTMIGEVFSRVGSSLSVDIWQSTIQVLKKVMDALASKNVLVEDYAMSRYYRSVLQCLHFALLDRKGPISDHVSGFVAALRLFFLYGTTLRPQHMNPPAVYKKTGSTSHTFNSGESSKSTSGRYRPPHLRKEDSVVDHPSSDSDFSDSDGPAKDSVTLCCSKARVAAILCIQDLCQADPKLFTAQWTMLLPSNDVLQPRKYEATLMTCLLFDPYLKARIATASTLVAMLDGPVSGFLQVAEFKESNKRGSFTALSSSLGQILMQLHTGILYLIKHETHVGLLPSLFKILVLLVSSTPYSRMPGNLLCTLISSLQVRTEDGFPLRSDQASLLAIAINCLTAALSTSPSSPEVKELLFADLHKGLHESQGKSSMLSTLFRFCEPASNTAICLEALQALRAVSHNYPDVIRACWWHVSSVVHRLLMSSSPDVSSRPWKANVGNGTGSTGDKVISAAIKVLDESLRAVSGFKGTEDLFDDKLFDTPFTSDFTRTKKVSSAPSYGSESLADAKDLPVGCGVGSEQWSEAIDKHMPLVLRHNIPMVRAASITCFAGITSVVFSSLPKEEQDFIISSCVNASLNDEVPSVRSAACRAIGVITCFPQISMSANILCKFIHAAEVNTRDPLVLVRITASWALANICDSLRHYIIADTSNECSRDVLESEVTPQSIELLVETALRLTKDGDKIKANAVRALGNLSRFVQFRLHSEDSHELINGNCHSVEIRGDDSLSSKVVLDDCGNASWAPNLLQHAWLESSRWLGRMVQAFLSCVSTGNVKVQWNVCHALSNLFLNKTLRLGESDWAPSVFSILLLLLRDSPNFKIRTQAASALAVPTTVADYGASFGDIIQGVEQTIENLSSDQITPSSFKYRIGLEKQLTSTMLHVLALASKSNHQPVKDFLLKKASFLEEWLKVLCSSLVDTSMQQQLETEPNSSWKEKKKMISAAIMSLVEVYTDKNQPATAQKFDQLANSLP